MDKNFPEYKEQPLMYKGRPVFGRLTTPYFDRMPKEYMENEACFIFVNRGKLSLRAPNAYIELDSGSAVLGKCVNYFFETTKAERRKGSMIQMTAVLLFPSLVEGLFEFDVLVSNHTLNYNVKQVKVDKLLRNFHDSLDILFENPEMADENMIRNKLKEFILIISKSENAPSQLDFLSALFKPNDVEFRTTIQNNLYSNLSLNELAILCHMSLSSFKRKFREVFNDSPKKYIMRKKAEKAAGLLRSIDLRISDIAYDVGFDTLSTFNRTFKAEFNITPTDYRLSQIA